MLSRRRSLLALLTLVGAVSIGSSASAAELYAGPSGTGDDCSQTSPCSLVIAVGAAKAGDEVIVGPGEYTAASVFVKAGVTVHGRAGLPRPRVTFTPGWCGMLVSNATVRYMELRQTGQCGALQAYDATIEQVIAHAPNETIAVRNSVVRNSIVTASGPSGAAISIAAPGVNNVTLRNVTAIAEGTGGSAIYARAGTAEGRLYVLARNVIARRGPGPGGAGLDVGTDGSGAIAKITVDHSNWDGAVTSGLNVSIVEGGGNQSVAPAFALFGGYRQAAGSATVDAGLDEIVSGAYDVDGDPRQIGGIDIGADELNPAPNATTGAASAVTQHSATLTGSVNPIGRPTRYHFQYGATAAYGAATPDVDAGNGGVIAATTALTALTPATTYHYRIVSTNALEDVKGADRTFTTLPAPVTPPSPGTGPAPADPPFAGVALVSRRLTSGRRAVTVRLWCRPGAVARCSGRTRLAARRTTLARSRFSIAAGARARVNLRLTRAGRRLLARNVRLRAKTVSAASDAAGRSTTTRVAVTIRRQAIRRAPRSA